MAAASPACCAGPRSTSTRTTPSSAIRCVAGQFEQFVMNWLLLAQPSNYSDALRGRSPAIAPRDVRRATDFIHANLAQPITLADLVGVSGVAGRTLLKHFGDVARRLADALPAQPRRWSACARSSPPARRIPWGRWR